MHGFIVWLQSLGELFGRYKQVTQVSWQNRSATDLKGYTKEEAEFLPAALALQETPVPVLPRVVMWVVIAMGGIGLVWSIVGKIDIVATAQGKIVTNARSKIIQSLETVRVKEINVHDGQLVKRGEVLVELDDTDAQSNDTHTGQDLMTARLLAARSRALLEAIHKNKTPTIPDITNVEPSLLEQERRLATSLYSEYATRMNQLSATEARHAAEKHTSEATIARLRKSLPITDKRAEDYKKLADTDYVPRHEFLMREQQRIEQRGDLSIQEQRVHELSAAIVETVRQRESLTAEMNRAFSTSLNEAEQKIAVLTADRQKTAARLKDLKLLSPVDGIVQQLAVHTLGGVVTPAQPLMVIVPTGEPIEIEATIENKDIGFVRANQEAEIKVEAFPYTKYGTLRGTVLNVSSDAIVDEKKGLIYVAHIHLDQTAINVGDKTIPLTPGMAVGAEIKTGKRRLIEYFLAPFVEYQKGSLRER